MRLVRPDAFFARLGATGTIGFGEAYMAGDWTTDDLAGVLSAFAANMRDLVPAAAAPAAPRRPEPRCRRRTTTPSTARATNIHHHYDLSNDLFKTFLDESLTYSVRDLQRRAVRIGRGSRRRAATQDRPAARQRRRRRRHPAARDRHRLGRARPPRRRARRAASRR